MSTWVVGASEGSPGSPMWTFSSNNGFNWTPVCSILPTVSTTIGGPVGLSANSQGFVATWLDSNDSNAYASFYSGPVMPPTNVTGCNQKYFLIPRRSAEYSSLGVRRPVALLRLVIKFIVMLDLTDL